MSKYKGRPIKAIVFRRELHPVGVRASPPVVWMADVREAEHLKPTQVIEHNGGNDILYSDLKYIPAEDVVISALTNVAGFPAHSFTPTLARIVFGEASDQPPKIDVAPVDARVVRSYAGRYQLPSAEKLYGFGMRTFLRFTLETWGRLSEVTGLLWEDVQFDNRAVVFRETKSHEDRFVPIAESSDLLDDLRRLQVQTLQAGGPFTIYADKSNTAKKRDAILKDAQIPAITIHDLRRTGITRALLANVPPVTVQRIAGHRDIKTTMQYYAQVNTQDLRDGVERVRAAG